ncbi:MAG: NAD(P)/FAD-dependent oxidoreductase [Chloroflexi bacterium]|nr:NAD(P)/FAD-dependent oxidoreductase [Chloroflexota bacterium]
MTNSGKIKIVVLGGGFAGVYATLHLERALRKDPRVAITLVSNDNFFMFTPFLHEVAVGRIETRHIAYPIRMLRGNRRFDFVLATVESIDLAGHTVATDRGALSYDYLVIALGSTTDTSGLPEGGQRVLMLKDLHDGITVRNHIIRKFENADSERGSTTHSRLLTFVVAGGGYTGVQMVAEISSFAWKTLLRHYPRISPDSIRVVLVQESSRILSDLDPRLSAIALKVVRRQGVEIMFNSRITDLGETYVRINGAQTLPTETVIWSTGVRASPVVSALPIAADEMGRAIVDRYLGLPGYPGVFAIGDNAHFKEPVTGEVLPPRAHIAVRQAKRVASNIVASIRGRPQRPYRYKYTGEIVSLGPGSAVARLYFLRLHGFAARVLWLVAYLSIMKGYYNRTRVLLDWFLSLVFGRDTTLLRLERLK